MIRPLSEEQHVAFQDMVVAVCSQMSALLVAASSLPEEGEEMDELAIARHEITSMCMATLMMVIVRREDEELARVAAVILRRTGMEELKRVAIHLEAEAAARGAK